MANYFTWALSYIKTVFAHCFAIIDRLIPNDCWLIIFGAFAFTAFCRLVLSPVVRPSTNVTIRRDNSNNAHKIRENIRGHRK